MVTTPKRKFMPSSTRSAPLGLASTALLAVLATPLVMASSSPEPGDPFPSLSAEQQALFDGGEEYFVNDLKVTEGLGPVYIEILPGLSCAGRHWRR